jgi:hypothetical protein
VTHPPAQITYELRTKSEGLPVSNHVNTLQELKSLLVQANPRQIIGTYVVYRDADGGIEKSEKLKYVLQGSIFSIKSVPQKKVKISPDTPKPVIPEPEPSISIPDRRAAGSLSRSGSQRIGPEKFSGQKLRAPIQDKSTGRRSKTKDKPSTEILPRGALRNVNTRRPRGRGSNDQTR